MVENYFVGIILFASSFSIAVSLYCFSCANITEAEDCSHVTQCQSGQNCYGEHKLYGNATMLTLGCTDSRNCPARHQFSIVGRSTSSPCTECCLGDGCNRELCPIQHVSDVHNPSVCTDDPGTNCTKLANLLNICSDIPHAKTVCRKYCGLCTLVDGDWAQWGGWSYCSTTCGLGVKSRSRSCSNPAPQHGGDQCAGNATELHSCYDRECPVHGQWNSWGPWESCSATCDGRGISKRHRFCTNPSPSLFGHDCIGDAVDFKICHGHPCTTASPNATTPANTCEDVLTDCPAANASTGICNNFEYARKMCPEFCGLCSIVDGKWASWMSWGDCSTTCDNGTMTRSRTCTNPPPAKGGKPCPGSGTEVAVCNLRPCPVHGGWTGWAHWTTCSSSCGPGITHRFRDCTNPRPSLQGNYCFGDSTEYGMCSIKACPVNGGWGDWSLWNGCSVSCGSGTKTRQRSCSSPRPANGGQTCTGASTETIQCNAGACSGVKIACHDKTTAWDITDTTGHIAYLDRQDVICDNHQYISRFRAQWDGKGHLRYLYTCCAVTLSVT